MRLLDGGGTRVVSIPRRRRWPWALVLLPVVTIAWLLLGCAADVRSETQAITGPAWTMTVLQPASATAGGPLRSAEGPAICWINGAPVVAAGWETSGEITLTTTVPPITTTVVDMHLGVEGVHCADVNGDGSPDVLSASLRNHRHLRISWGPDYNPAEATQILAADAIVSWKWITAGDVNNDGRVDVIASGRNESGQPSPNAAVMWFESATPEDGATWTGHHVAYVGDTYTLEARDLNFDGRLDIFVSDKRGGVNVGTQNGAWWYEGDGAGGFTGHQFFDPIGEAFGAALADFDGDGSIEMVTARRSSASGEWLQSFKQTAPGVWTGGPNIMPMDVGLGEVHGVNVCDVGIGRPVVVASFVRGDPGVPWVLWIDPVTGEAHDVSGPAVDMDGDMSTGCYRKTDQLRCANGVIYATEGGDSCILDDYGVVKFTRSN